MELSLFKPLLTALVLPPASLLLLALMGLVLAWRRKRRGLLLCAAALAALWLLSCQGTAVWLASTVLPQYLPATAAQLTTTQVQAIVVLGGGAYPQAPEYGAAQPNPETAARLRYGVWLSKRSGLPIAFTGGTGWASQGMQAVPEALIADRVAQQDYGVKLRWLESQSRDTAENAQALVPMLKRDGIQRIALVTDALHMPRSVLEFERQGMTVIPAPMGFVLPTRSGLLLWLPSADGMATMTRTWHELLGLTVARLR